MEDYILPINVQEIKIPLHELAQHFLEIRNLQSRIRIVKLLIDKILTTCVL